MIAIVMIIAAFVCIFVETNWTWIGPTPYNLPAPSSPNYWYVVHAMVGILAVVLAWFQPIMAVFRCHPGGTFRFIFNYLHFAAGISAWALAGIV
jgi:hypothetical protein